VSGRYAPGIGGLHDLARALELAESIPGEVPELIKVLRRTESLEEAAQMSRDQAAALAFLLAADRVIQVDDFPWPE